MNERCVNTTIKSLNYILKDRVQVNILSSEMFMFRRRSTSNVLFMMKFKIRLLI